jgi:hypothetical protein
MAVVMVKGQQKESRQASASRLLREYLDARDLVSQLIGRAQARMASEPVDPTASLMDAAWMDRWEKATKRERTAQRAWHRFLDNAGPD